MVKGRRGRRTVVRSDGGVGWGWMAGGVGWMVWKAGRRSGQRNEDNGEDEAVGGLVGRVTLRYDGRVGA